MSSDFCARGALSAQSQLRAASSASYFRPPLNEETSSLWARPLGCQCRRAWGQKLYNEFRLLRTRSPVGPETGASRQLCLLFPDPASTKKRLHFGHALGDTIVVERGDKNCALLLHVLSAPEPTCVAVEAGVPINVALVQPPCGADGPDLQHVIRAAVGIVLALAVGILLALLLIVLGLAVIIDQLDCSQAAAQARHAAPVELALPDCAATQTRVGRDVLPAVLVVLELHRRCFRAIPACWNLGTCVPIRGLLLRAHPRRCPSRIHLRNRRRHHLVKALEAAANEDRHLVDLAGAKNLADLAGARRRRGRVT